MEPASLVVVDPGGSRTRVPLDPLPFHIGRQPESNLIVRDSRASRTHSRILGEENRYIIEDCGSRHGTYVNGEPITRHVLEHGDRIEFGVPDSYHFLFALDGLELKNLMEQVGAAERATSAPHGVGGNLPKLRAILDLARTLQSSFSVEDVLAQVVDAALAIAGAERGFLMLRQGEGLETRVARNREGRTLKETELRVPRHVLHRALQHRRELLSMNFNPLAAEDSSTDRSVASLELRSVICVPLVRIRAGQGDATSLATAANETVGVLYMDSRVSRGRSGGRQPGAAANARHRSFHRTRKRPSAGRGARQTRHGRGDEPGPQHSAEPAAAGLAERWLAARLRQQRGVARGGRRLFRREPCERKLLVGGSGGRFG